MYANTFLVPLPPWDGLITQIYIYEVLVLVLVVLFELVVVVVLVIIITIIIVILVVVQGVVPFGTIECSPLSFLEM